MRKSKGAPAAGRQLAPFSQNRSAKIRSRCCRTVPPFRLKSLWFFLYHTPSFFCGRRAATNLLFQFPEKRGLTFPRPA